MKTTVEVPDDLYRRAKAEARCPDIDSDFAIYRKHGRVPLTVVHPAVPD